MGLDIVFICNYVAILEKVGFDIIIVASDENNSATITIAQSRSIN